MTVNYRDECAILRCVQQITDAVRSLAEIASDYDEETMNAIIAKSYPFQYSLDELSWEIDKWNSSVYKSLLRH